MCVCIAEDTGTVTLQVDRMSNERSNQSGHDDWKQDEDDDDDDTVGLRIEDAATGYGDRAYLVLTRVSPSVRSVAWLCIIIAEDCDRSFC
jgi:hypothetical protein